MVLKTIMFLLTLFLCSCVLIICYFGILFDVPKPCKCVLKKNK